jgi:hypothetical protein
MRNALETAVASALMNFTLTFFVLGLLAAGIAVAGGPKPVTGARAARALADYFILFNIGLGFAYNFVTHVFFGSLAAAFIGWPDSPFQTEVGWASLGFALVGFAAFKARPGVQFLAVLGPAAFLWGAAATHAVQMATAGNFAPGNAGIIFYTDILLPVIGFLFVGLSARRRAGHYGQPAAGPGRSSPAAAL